MIFSLLEAAMFEIRDSPENSEGVAKNRYAPSAAGSHWLCVSVRQHLLLFLVTESKQLSV